MSNQNVFQGTITGTGAAINVELGFVPSRIRLISTPSSVKGHWSNNMPNGSFCVEEVAKIAAVAGTDLLIGYHIPSIGTTPTQIANKLCVGYFEDAGATAITMTAVAAGTAFTGTTHDVTTGGLWGCFKLSCQTGGTKIITPSAALNYATEALAIAALPATPGNEISLGYCTIQSGAAAIWDATTDVMNLYACNFYGAYGIMTGGITPYSTSFLGFTLGTSAHLNVIGGDVRYVAYR